MAGTYVVAVEGLAELKSFDTLPQDILVAARRAVNKTTDRAYAASGRGIRMQVNLPARYVTGKNGRLRIKSKASGTRLEGVIEGRQRPTSLARFASGGAPGRKGGVTVEVKPGGARFMKRAFLMRLRSGAQLTDTKFNLGLAIRLREGESIRNKREMIRLDRNLYLLYGPSIDQVFRDVADDVAPQTADYLEAEFARLLDARIP